ncbi:hypothetical protein [Planococcus sp. CAU13]|uniref:hypothetical protein n=1 Tax=Planococcus sp. CAU13 TaxID=1541197 RepID=UPI00052FF5F2|nr:hypothetical protein [Planococcus sp. CAU13]
MNKLTFLLMFLVLLLTSCQAANPDMISLDEVVSSFENQQIPIKENKEPRKDSIFSMKLNGVKPAHYELEGKMLLVYIYKSPEKREKGLQDFHDKTAAMDTVSYNTYEVKNVLIFYVYEHDMSLKVKFDDAIKEVMSELEGQ